MRSSAIRPVTEVDAILASIWGVLYANALGPEVATDGDDDDPTISTEDPDQLQPRSPDDQQSPLRQKPADPDRRLRRIARAGKQWKKTIARHVDMEGEFSLSIIPRNDDLIPPLAAYVYRLCLEWARLVADDRDTMNY